MQLLKNTEFILHSNAKKWIFIRPENQDAILEQLSDEECMKDSYFPYWAEHWPSAGIFSTFCADQFPNQYDNICELGSGLGVLSTILKEKGLNIIATDISFQSCQYSSINISKYKLNPKVICCDWRNSPFKQQFDCIVASDILYEKRFIDPVLKFIKSNLTQNGHVYMADPCRSYWQFFKSEAVYRGFSIEEILKEKTNNNKTTIEIIKLSIRN